MLPESKQKKSIPFDNIVDNSPLWRIGSLLFCRNSELSRVIGCRRTSQHPSLVTFPASSFPGSGCLYNCFFADSESFHLLPRISHRCSLYQHSNSCCPVSESPRNLLVSFHLGKYHSDKQITSPKSQKNLCM